MKVFRKRIFSMILVLALVVGMMPMTVLATGVTEANEFVHEHEYENVVTDPTCTEQGYTTYACECGDSYVNDYVDAVGEHDFTDWSVVREATYELAGEENRVCQKCSHVEYRPLELTVVTSGNVGYGTPYTDAVTYTLYSDGTMVIEGTGKVYCSDWRGNTQPYYDYRDQVKELVIKEGITQTQGGCFAYFVNLESVSFPDSFTKINKNAFMNSFVSSLKSITIPETVTYLADYAFGFYSGESSAIFTDIIIENPDVSFHTSNAVFNSGKKLQDLTLYSYGAENNVRSYAEAYGCRYIDLNNYLEGNIGDVHYELSSGILRLDPLVENASVPAEDQPWKSSADQITKIVISEGVATIPSGTFANYTALTEVELPFTLQSIGDGAFAVSESNETPLSMALPRRLASLGNNLFAGRTNVNLTVYYGSLGSSVEETGVNLEVKKEFKLMLIGNSYSEDASNGSHTQTSQLLDILQAMLGRDTEITVALLYSGGKGMHWHATQAEQGNSAYSFKVISTTNPTWKSQGSYTSADALAWTDWDAVSLQPYNINVSSGQESVPYPDSTDPKFYHIEESSAYMLDHVDRYAPYADIYFYMHWAQTSSTVLNAALNNYNKNAAFMPQVLEYAGTESGAQFKTIIPVGLAVQNARTTYLSLLRYNTTAYADGNLNLVTDAQIGLQRDGGHVSFNIGRYIAALTFAEMVVPENMRVEGYVLPDIRVTESVGILPQEYSVIAQKAVHAAVEGWREGSLAVTNIEGYSEDPTVAAIETLENMKLNIACGNQEAEAGQIRKSVQDVLPVDFVVETLTVDIEQKIAMATIRFGYTSVTVEMAYSFTGHNYKNGICSDCGEKDPDGLVLDGLNVLCLGDSITAGQGLTTDTRWTNVLACKYNWTLTNESQGGISLSSYYYKINGKKDVSIAKKAEVLKTMTEKPDVIIVWGGHNDTSYRAAPLGTWEDETTGSFKGALKYIDELADEYAPDATLFVLTPLWNNEKPSTLKVPENTTDNNWMFVDAIYEGAEKYGWIPINMDLCGITPFTKTGLLQDNIHPNNAGTEKIVEYLSEELASYGQNSKKETIIFDRSSIALKAGESTALKAVLSPRSGVANAEFMWKSTDSSVAIVDSNGKITAVAPGNAVITVMTGDGASEEVSVVVECDHVYVNGSCIGCGEAHANLANYKGKVISILGDSISTFAGYIPTADGYNLEHYARYPQDNLFTDVKHTWWMQVLTTLDAKLGINDSWRSTEVYNYIDEEVNSSYDGTKACMASTTRIQNLGSNGTPDVILFFGGTNDITQSRPVGAFEPEVAPTVVDLISVKWDTVADAYVDAIMRMQYYYPDAEIVAMLPYYRSSQGTAKVDQYNDVFTAICEHYGVPVVDLRSCGITMAEIPDGTHPDTEGMDDITAAVLDVMLSKCDVEAGEHVVHSVTHELTDATSSNSYYKGVSHGKSFTTTIKGESLKVTVTMGGVDITADCYANCIISIADVTGDVVITVVGKEKSVYADHLQQLPSDLCSSLNLWTALEPENQYYTTTGWGNLSTGQIWSITIPVTVGDRIYANSFAKNGNNGNNYSSTSGIRVTYFDDDGVYKSLSPAAVYEEFAANGYLTIPENVTVICVPMWTNTEESVVYVLNRDHIYDSGTCLGCGAYNGPTITQQPTNGEAKLGQRYMVEVLAEGEGLRYQWYFRNTGSDKWYKSSVKDNTYDDVMTKARAGREVYCVITDANGNKVTTDTVKLIRTQEKLEIIAQPTDVAVAFDDMFCATVEAKGDGLKYQWYFRNAGTLIWYKSGVRDNTYDDIMTKARNGREIYCVITDAYGNTVTTDTVKLTAVPSVELKILNQTYESAAMGERYCLTVNAQGEGLKYQWYFRNAGSKQWYKSGVRDNTYDDVMTKARSNRDVYCVITDAFGNQVTTEMITLTVNN